MRLTDHAPEPRQKHSTSRLFDSHALTAPLMPQHLIGFQIERRVLTVLSRSSDSLQSISASFFASLIDTVMYLASVLAAERCADGEPGIWAGDPYPAENTCIAASPPERAQPRGLAATRSHSECERSQGDYRKRRQCGMLHT